MAALFICGFEWQCFIWKNWLQQSVTGKKEIYLTLFRKEKRKKKNVIHYIDWMHGFSIMLTALLRQKWHKSYFKLITTLALKVHNKKSLSVTFKSSSPLNDSWGLHQDLNREGSGFHQGLSEFLSHKAHL